MSVRDSFGLAREVVRVLEEEEIPAVVIGAVALSQYGVARATFDIDLLVAQPKVLTLDWRSRVPLADDVDVRRADPFDAVAGLVRLTAAGQQQVDLVLAKWDWMKGVIDRAEPVTLMGVDLEAATRTDLIRLKLDAGGPRDAWDIDALLDSDDSGGLEAEVTASISDQTPAANALWAEILRRRARAR